MAKRIVWKDSVTGFHSNAFLNDYVLSAILKPFTFSDWETGVWHIIDADSGNLVASGEVRVPPVIYGGISWLLDDVKKKAEIELEIQRMLCE